MNLQAIQALAQQAQYNNYEGDHQDAYTGFGDDDVDFGGKHLSFASELASDRVFSITVDNTGAGNAYRVVSITPSFSPTAAGNVITDGNNQAMGGLSATGAPKTIKEFQDFVARNPTSVVGVKVSSTHASQLAEVLTLERKSPFGANTQELIALSSFTSETAANDKMVTVRRPFQVDDQTECRIGIPAGARTTITFYCGAVYNTAKSLHNKSSKAGQNSQVATTRAMIAAGN